MNQFPYENLSDDEFEELAILVCKEILGIGAKTFSLGKDGAKDSWFTGTAEKFPSIKDPWKGDFCIQAKHTKTYNSSCSDNDFSVNQTSILDKEIKRLNELKPKTYFDNYILFTNRKLTGLAYPDIIQKLQKGLALKNVDVIGREQLDTFLTDYPHIANKFGLYKFVAPLRFYEKDLRDIIIIFSEHKATLRSQIGLYIKTFDSISIEEKNALNNLSEDYFTFIKEHSLQYFLEIGTFLRDPKNEVYMKMYTNTVSDLQDIIAIERNNFAGFEYVLKHLIDYIVDNNEDKLKYLRSIVRVFVHFMYFNCDIGKIK